MGVGGPGHIPAALAREKDLAPILQEGEWAPKIGLDGFGKSRPYWDSIPGLYKP